MQPRDAFAVALRVVGLLISCAGLLYLLSAALLVFVPHYRADAAPAWHYLLSGAIAVAVGAYLLRGAPQVVRFAYGRERPDT